MSKRKKYTFYAIIIFLVLFIGGYFYFTQRQPKYEFLTVKKGDIAQEVSVTGKTKPAESVSLAFEKGGKITRIMVKVGDAVFVGQTLAIQDASELLAQLRQNEANVAVQKAKLAELKAGTRPEEIEVYETKITNAQTSLEEARKNLLDKIQDAFTKSEDAVRGKGDQFFTDSSSPYPKVNITVNDSQLKINLESGRYNIESVLISWKNKIDVLDKDNDLLNAAAEADKNANLIKVFLADLAIPVNMLSANSSLTQTVIDSYKTAISTARTNTYTAISNLSAAKEKFTDAESAVAVAKQDLNLKEAGSTIEQIQAQEAQVAQTVATLQITQAQLAKTILRSPINGLVTKQDAKLGEIAAANTSLISIISQSQLEIEANVPEVDVGRLALDNPVKITLDAFPGETFQGHLVYIDPAETVIDGVVNFKIRLNFDKADERLKSGLTSNLDIQTLTKTGVLVLPQFAVLENDNGKFVRKVEGKKTKDYPITIGIRSQDGLVEIISGLSEGDQVLNIGVKNGNAK